MVHILLMILRGLGILAGGILVLLLLILALILLVPLRYQARVVKNETAFFASGQIGWFFGLIRLKLHAEPKKKPSADLLVFGRPLGRLLSRKKESRDPAADIPPGKGPVSKKSEPPKVEKWSAKRRMEPPTDEECSGERRTEPSMDEERSVSDSASGSGQSGTGPQSVWYERIAVLLGGLGFAAGTAAAYAAGFLMDLLGTVFDLPRLITAVIARILDGPANPFSEHSEWKNRISRAGALLDKPEEFLAFANDYQLKEIMALALREIKILVRHFRPRDLSGSLDFGTGDPAATGILAGLICLILPAGADSFSVTEDFYEKHLETDATLKGHIRLCHLVRAAWHLLKEKKVRRLITRIRKKNRQ